MRTSITPRLVRWLALIGSCSASISIVIGQISHLDVWRIAALIASLLSVAMLALGWRATAEPEPEPILLSSLPPAPEKAGEMSSLQEELDLHRRLGRELADAKQTAEAAMMAKGEFLATMSHEIRTPLNGILPMLDLLMGSRLPPDQHALLQTAYSSAQQMQRIVDDILDYSKLEANKLQLETTSFNLRELLQSVSQLMEKSADTKGLRLTLQIDPSVRLAVRGDPVRLRQVLTNLISNAIKFTARGGITVTVSRRGETHSQHELRFEVKDTGIGISRENAARLFRPFSQADASTTRLYGGTGLGLVICKRIVDLMGGAIGVQSEVGQGTLFWFDIPLLKAAGDMHEVRADFDGARILLLSTDESLREKLTQAGQSWGVHLSLTETTHDALERLRTASVRVVGDWAFDLLIVDLNSARSTAIALVRNLRRMPELGGLRVVYLFGDDPPSQELMAGVSTTLALARTMGANELRRALVDFLRAPVAQPDTHSSAMAPPISGQPGTRTATSGSTASEPAEPTRIVGNLLLVEDNPVNLMVAQRLISLLGVHCEVAENGQLAIDRLLAGNIDLVLMDCQMPVKDGYAATREWRQHELNQQLPRLPIIAMTANAMAGDRQKCLDAGMDDYLTKPVDRRLLESLIRQHLAASRQRAAASPPAPASSAAVAVQTAPQATPAVREPIITRAAPLHAPAPAVSPVPAALVAAPAPAPPPAPAPITSAPLDLEIVDELRAVMGSEFTGLVHVFLEDAPGHVERLEVAASANDLAAMVAPAHTLKSAAANLGAMAVSEAAKRIEAGARQGNLPRAAVAVAVLDAELRRAETALLSQLR